MGDNVEDEILNEAMEAASSHFAKLGLSYQEYEAESARVAAQYLIDRFDGVIVNMDNEIARLKIVKYENAQAMAHIAKLITQLHPDCQPLDNLSGRLSQLAHIVTEIPKLRAEIAQLKGSK